MSRFLKVYAISLSRRFRLFNDNGGAREINPRFLMVSRVQEEKLYLSSMKNSLSLSRVEGGQRTRAIKVASASMCAALYAVAAAATSPIPTPWGVGHFRPGVVVPAFFAVASTPMVAGLRAAIGTFVASFVLSMFGLSNPVLSLVAGVPGNFVGFYLLGWLTSRYRSWRSFTLSSLTSLVVGNFIAAAGVMAYFSLMVPVWASWPLDVKVATVLGFTLFWVATMLPFVVPLVPLLIRATKPLSRRAGSLIQAGGLNWGKPLDLIYPSVTVALILAIVYAGIVLTPVGDALFIKAVRPEHMFWVKTLFLVAGGVVLAFGVAASLLVTRQLRSLEAQAFKVSEKLS